MILIANKYAKSEYDIKEPYTAGIQLEGREVKSLRLKMGSLKGSFVKIVSGEAFLINAQINPYSFAKNDNFDPKRTRKLLLNKKEIDELVDYSDQKGFNVVPLAIVLLHNKIKLEIGSGRGRKIYEKKAVLKARDIARETEREIKGKRF